MPAAEKRIDPEAVELELQWQACCGGWRISDQGLGPGQDRDRKAAVVVMLRKHTRMLTMFANHDDHDEEEEQEEGCTNLGLNIEVLNSLSL